MHYQGQHRNRSLGHQNIFWKPIRMFYKLINNDNVTDIILISHINSKITQVERSSAVQLRGLFRSSYQDVFCKKDVLRNFAKFIGTHLF